MIVTKQNIGKARYAAPPEITDAISRTLSHLPGREAAAARHPRRLAVLVACAAVLVCGVAVASIPSTRAYAEGLIRSIFKLYAGQPGSGFSPGPTAGGGTAAAAGSAQSTADPGSAYEQLKQDKFAVIAAHSVPVNTSQTAGGVKATVLEAAILDSKLFLGMAFDNVPQYCFPAEEVIRINIDGQQLGLGSLRQSTTIDGAEVFSLEAPLSMAQEELPDRFTVRLMFLLRQFPDGGNGKGNEIATFDMDFQMDKPNSFATLPPEEAVGAGPVEITSAPAPMEITSAPAPRQNGLDPDADQNLTEPAGVEAWTQFTSDEANVSFEIPQTWRPDEGAELLPELSGRSERLAALSGTDGYAQVYAVQTGASDLIGAEDAMRSFLKKRFEQGGGMGTEYNVDDGMAFFMWSNGAQTSASLILMKLDSVVDINGKSYDCLLIWAPKDYNTHILRTLKKIS